MASAVVLDASAWLAVLLNEEGSQVLQPIMMNHLLVAPELLFYEAANGVLYAARGSSLRIKKDSLPHLLDLIFGFPIRKIPMEQWWVHSLGLIHRHAITFYDAAYVACAKTLDIPLLTLDKKMAEVLKSENLELVEF